ncbi:uncharacterized protein PAC_19520 [Phialocephala subalpina]|uniref:Heterokaryon incompatibility domain-containing protein n=1 Tax=Phialocephala subalpina TaxID=576137 RepID=A0A1L7XX96_9HELO|nr:uncharacterized protein PAC_19520 [Phialocephala subalpina]
MLCENCESLCCDVLTGDIRNSKWVSNSLNAHVLEFAYENSEALVHNAYTGSCDLFLFFHRELDSLAPHQRREKKKIRIVVSPFADLNKFRPWQLCFTNPEQRYAFFFSGQSERVPETFNTLDVEIAESVKRHIGFMSSRYSGSDTVCALAAHWLSLCATEHSKCRGRNRDMPFPSRLIDIRERDSLLGWTQPRIVSTKGRFGSYTTLSYRWSKVGQQFCPTKENIEWLMKSIRLNLLPKTISEAIAFLRQLDFRYLWVDSLCIIQNDDDDWRRECGKMASVFQNSHLTISALHARDSHAGWFHHRTPHGLRLCPSFHLRDGTKLVLRSVNDMVELQWEVDASAMGSRGWITREDPQFYYISLWRPSTTPGVRIMYDF